MRVTVKMENTGDFGCGAYPCRNAAEYRIELSGVLVARVCHAHGVELKHELNRNLVPGRHRAAEETL